MENASKALIMAASVLIGIVIISAFVIMMSNMTSNQQKNYDTELTAQVSEFNNQFMTYARDGIRGSDMISLMNRIADYNTRYTGTEGYTESIASGMLAGINMARYLNNEELIILPKETILGALANYISDEAHLIKIKEDKIKHLPPQPINSNWGILPPIELPKKERKNKKLKNELLAKRSLETLDSFIKEINI